MEHGKDKEVGALFQAVYSTRGPVHMVLTVHSEQGIPSLEELVFLEKETPEPLRTGAPLGTFSHLKLLHTKKVVLAGREAQESFWLAKRKGMSVFLKRTSFVVGLTAVHLRFDIPTLLHDSLKPAVHTLLEGIQLGPKSHALTDEVDAYRSLGQGYLKQKQYENAIRVAQIAVNLSPIDPSLQLLLAKAAHHGEKLDLSEQAYREAIRLFPSDPHPYQGLAQLMVDQGDPQMAIRFLEEAISLASQDASLHADLGRVLLGEGRPSEALESFRKAIRRDRKLVEARLGLARTYKAVGENDLAVNAYHVTLQMEPNLKEVHCELEEIYLLQGYTAEAQAERTLCPLPPKGSSDLEKGPVSPPAPTLDVVHPDP